MTRILFIHSQKSTENVFKNTLEKSDCKLLTASPCDDIGEVVASHNVSLVIWSVDSPDKEIDTQRLSPSDSLPLLIVEPDGAAVNHSFHPDGFITVDYLPPPYSQEKVEKKLTHLLQVRQFHLDLVRANNTIEKLEKRIAGLNKSLNGHNEFLDLISRRDGLTGLYNRRHFNEMCKDAFTHASDREDELSLAILNVDYFNEINRSCGQDFGDFVLNELSARLTSLSREQDLCFRLSGEDFAILMPVTSAEGAWQISERLRKSCATKTFDNNHYSRKITISVGISSLQKHHPHSHEELISMADQALFYAKSEGRNRTMYYIPIDRDNFGTSEKNFKILQDTISRILGKTKVATLRSLQELAANAGTQFDPFLVMKLIDVIEEKGILGDNVKDLENTRKIIQKSCSP